MVAGVAFAPAVGQPAPPSPPDSPSADQPPSICPGFMPPLSAVPSSPSIKARPPQPPDRTSAPSTIPTVISCDVIARVGGVQPTRQRPNLGTQGQTLRFQASR